MLITFIVIFDIHHLSFYDLPSISKVAKLDFVYRLRKFQEKHANMLCVITTLSQKNAFFGFQTRYKLLPAS